AERQAELLPVPYFHVVFTLPAPAREIAFQNKAVVYAILFRCAAETLTTIAADPKHLGAQLGVTAVLHTWGQPLQHHPHIHCVVPGGGPSLDGTHWVACRPGFFLPVRVLSRLFRRLFLQELQADFAAGQLGFFGDLVHLADPAAFAERLAQLRRTDWVVYAKPPFGGPEQVLACLSRYTHRVAIANSRLISLAADDKVSFAWKDFRQNRKAKVMTLNAGEFIRRFLLHTLPDGFHRIRHYGFLANGGRNDKIVLCRQLLAVRNAP
ncbi:transposase, partial [Bradyrhizobium sp. NBAIM03]|uniref:IS91 family transposase n=1 Tax=Bradyrhizobium sp. NBAIM03 TaxID=2793816 RepID=UPI001CD7352C